LLDWYVLRITNVTSSNALCHIIKCMMSHHQMPEQHTWYVLRITNENTVVFILTRMSAPSAQEKLRHRSMPPA
jgi:hypothetical protein